MTEWIGKKIHSRKVKSEKITPKNERRYIMKRENKILIGIWHKIIPAPVFMLIMDSVKMAKVIKARINKLPEEKRRIHHFVVRELPNAGQPISLAFIAQGLKMPVDRVSTLVDEMEKGKTFFNRYHSEGINWAYPVTVDNTPHHVTFSTGEQVNAA